MEDQGFPQLRTTEPGTAALRVPTGLVPPHAERRFYSTEGEPKSVLWGPPHSQ